MKRCIISLLFVVWSTTLFSEELCGEWEKQLSADDQMPEKLFSKANHDASERFLESVGQGRIKDFDITEPQNAKKIVRGYQLKTRALDELVSGETEHALSEYCEFIVMEAFFVR